MLKTLHKLSRLRKLNVTRQFISCYHHLNLKHTDYNYSIIEMKKEPVNSFSLEFMEELITAIDCVEKTSRGLVITSNLKSFGAGLDLVELCNSQNSQFFFSFWKQIQDLHLRLYLSPLVTIAAINGHAVAGAFALMLACDYRIMVDGRYQIGLPTVHTGILVPRWLAQLFKLTIGCREAERYLCLGKLSFAQEALSSGLVDEVVPADDLMNCTFREMDKWLSIPDAGRIKTKELMRRNFINEFYEGRDDDMKEFTTMMMDPAFLEQLRSYTGRLKSK